MKKTIAFFATLVLFVGILSGCNSSNNQGSSSNKNKNNENTQVNKDSNNATEQDSGNEDKENTEKKEDNSKNSSSTGNFKDQTDLKIGDTGKLESTLGKYEITVKSIKLKNEIGGEVSQIDHLFLTEITIKNIGDQPIDAAETIGLLELTDDLEGSGSPNDSDFYKVSKPFSGEIKPGQTMTGEAVFQGLDSKTYYIRVTPGLIAASAVKNKAIWTFKKSEAE
ncbi:DUF4352 domain-containing protein [Heyndrickxia vini]|uniref:DUF4352 domain-containing protein n=1 Tax=Heyndrickxia vini TaxID=1476025 RepID=A0ABX7E550_9BACI|nr:DUF4352 domain-containing protein [Heyndrickxia vini]QQZ10430.1 DUF4352 domain-containing protein [Heyndrickxia vini]